MQQRRCRLKPEGVPATLELDLRKPRDLERSRLLHRLDALAIPWGTVIDGRRSIGTFRETWQLRWEPELEVRVIEACALGTTVDAAARAALAQRTARSSQLDQLTGLIEQALLAGLPETFAPMIERLAQQSALESDVQALMRALPPLARTVRYGDVRGTDGEALSTVLASMIVRIAAGLDGAAFGLGDEPATAFTSDLDATVAALRLVDDRPSLALLTAAISRLVEHPRVHALVQGRATRILSDDGALGPAQAAARFSRSLSIGAAALDGGHFVEGFLGTTGAVLIHDPDLLAMIDTWLAQLDNDSFTSVLALLRRTFARFELSERRHIGEQVRNPDAAVATAGAELDPDRVAAALATIAQLLGIGAGDRS